MKIDLKLPSGGELHFQREPKEPMSKDRFEALCMLAAGAMVLVFVLNIIWATS